MNDFAVGSVAGTGAAINVSVGFQPRYIRVVNTAKNVVVEYIDGIGAGKGIKDQDQAVAEGGSASYTVGPQFISSNGITKYAGSSSAPEGFTIGADTDLNVSGDTLYYVAHR